MNDETCYIITPGLSIEEQIMPDLELLWEDDEPIYFAQISLPGGSLGGVVTAYKPRHSFGRRLADIGTVVLVMTVMVTFMIGGWLAVKNFASQPDPPTYTRETKPGHCRDFGPTLVYGARQGWAGCRITP